MDRFFLATNDVELTSIKYNKQRRESGKLVLEEGLPRLMELYALYKIHATFFVTGDIAEQFPQIPRLITDNGHELGSHSYSHEDSCALDLLGLDDQKSQMIKSKKILEDASGMEVVSFRAPALRVNNYTPQALYESGFKLDSSISPQRADMFFSFGALKKVKRLWAKRKPGFVDKCDLNKRGDYPIYEIPISALILPYVGTMLRITPTATNILKAVLCCESIHTGQPINFLIHPNECMIEDDFDTIERRSQNYISYLLAERLRRALKLRNLGVNAVKLYATQLQYFADRQYKFVTCKEYYNGYHRKEK